MRSFSLNLAVRNKRDRTMLATGMCDRCIGIGSRLIAEFVLPEDCFNKVWRVAWCMENAC
jgi:hypothetical protein